MMKKYLLALLGLALVIRVSAQIVGGAGVCAVRGNPNSIATLNYQAPAQECLLAIDTLTGLRYRYDPTQLSGFRWIADTLQVLVDFPLAGAGTNADPIRIDDGNAPNDGLIWNGTAWEIGPLPSGGGGGTFRPDSTFAKTNGAYSGKRIADNVYKNGKLGLNTTDTLATLNLKGANPVGSVLTWLYNHTAPPRSAYKGPTWVNGSQFNLSRIDINPMKPGHFPAFNYGVWTDQLFVDSTTNAAVGAPGNSIRNVGFNVDGANTKMARWYWSTEQYYYPTTGGSIDWEHHLEVRDTLNRVNRPFNLNARHNGNFYGAGFSTNDFYVRRPFTDLYALRMNVDDGRWRTDLPFSFRINSATRTGRLIERLHAGDYLNVLDWFTNGALQVGDVGGIDVYNTIRMRQANSGYTRIVSNWGAVLFDSTSVEILGKEPNYRFLTARHINSPNRWTECFDGSEFFFEKNFSSRPIAINTNAPSWTFTIAASGDVGCGLTTQYPSYGARLMIADYSSPTRALLKFENTTGQTLFYRSSATPESVISANPSDVAFVNQGGFGALYGKYTGTSNTGWGKFLNLIDPNSATSGQVLTWNGSAWVPTTQTITGIGTFQTAGNAAGLSIASNQLRAHRVTATTPGMLSTLDDTKTGSLTNITTDAYNFIAQNTGTGLFGYAFKNNSGITRAEITADETPSNNVFLNFGGQQAGRGLDNFISCDGDANTVKIFDGLVGTFQTATTQVEQFADINTAGALDADYSIQYINLGSNGTMTIPTTFPTGTKLDLYNLSGGGVTVTIQAGGGETIRGGNISFTSTDQRVTLRKRGTEWIHWE